MKICPSCGAENPERFTFCGACASPLADPGADTRKTVSIIFCDLVDSTALGTVLDGEVLRDVLAGYWRRARSVVERHGGTLEKFIGDAVVGVFGIPVVHEDDALRAVRSATELLVEVQDLNKDLAARVGVELAVRIGVNTGEVLSGGEALMSGDAANVAARLEQVAAAGEVLVGEATYRLVRDVVDAVAVEPLVVKGKAEPLVAFRLLGVRPAGSGQRRRRFSGPLVGRRRQLRIAEAMYATAVEESACVLLTVVGEPGVGKSRLVEELLAGIGADALVLQGRCLPYGEGITYWPTVEMLTTLAETDPTPLAEHVSSIAHGNEVLAGLQTMMGGVRTATAPEVAWAFRRLVETLAAHRPVVLVVDDVQWAEPGLVDLLDHLTDMSRGAPILLVCMARPEFQQARSGWGASRLHAFTMALRPLSDSDCHQLTAQLLGPQVGTALLDTVVAAAEGVPLFVEELTAMLVDDGQLVPADGGGWQRAEGLDTVTVPPSVQAVLAARLDLLADDLRRVVDVASVVGEIFYPDALRALLGDADPVLARVEALVRADLFRPTTTDLPGQDAYTFVHLLLRDAAYRTLTKARRAVLHRTFARWLEQQSALLAGPEVVALHLEAASSCLAELNDPDPDLAVEAARRLLEGADRAVARDDPRTAIGLAVRARALAPAPSGLQAEIALTLGEAAHEDGDFSTALRCADELERTGTALGDVAIQWRARLLRGRVRLWTEPVHSIEDTHALASEAIEVLGETGDDRGLMMAYLVRSEIGNELGRLRAASADARKGLQAAHRSGQSGTIQDRLVRRFIGPFRYGDGSLAEMTRAVDELSAELRDDSRVIAELAEQRDRLHSFHLHIDDAVVAMRDRYALLLEKGLVLQTAECLTWSLGWCQRWAGDLSGAADSMAQAAALLGSVGETGSRCTTLAELALMLARLGRDDEAQAACAESLAIAQDNDLLTHMYLAAAQGLLLARQGDSVGAERHHLESLRIADGTEFLQDHGDVWLAWSSSCELLGDTAGAVAAARQALVCFEREDLLPPIQTARATLARLAG